MSTQLLTIADVAVRLNISKTEAYELAHGDLRHGALRIGRSIRVQPEYLEKWIERQMGHLDPPVPGRAPVRR